VIFAESTEAEWHQTPTFRVGQSGVFLLDRQEIPELQTEAYVALDPLAYQPPERLESIAGLIGEPGEPAGTS